MIVLNKVYDYVCMYFEEQPLEYETYTDIIDADNYDNRGYRQYGVFVLDNDTDEYTVDTVSFGVGNMYEVIYPELTYNFEEDILYIDMEMTSDNLYRYTSRYPNTEVDPENTGYIEAAENGILRGILLCRNADNGNFEVNTPVSINRDEPYIWIPMGEEGSGADIEIEKVDFLKNETILFPNPRQGDSIKVRISVNVSITFTATA